VVAGLRHDVGKLVLAARAPAHFKRAREETEAEGRPLYAVETDLIGVWHAEVGAYLLGIWGLPSPVVEAVAHHHHPERVPSAETISQLEIDPEYLERLGVTEQRPGWQEMAKASVGELHVKS
jgi:HD-like signal output (HDOD) protein